MPVDLISAESTGITSHVGGGAYRALEFPRDTLGSSVRQGGTHLKRRQGRQTLVKFHTCCNSIAEDAEK